MVDLDKRLRRMFSSTLGVQAVNPDGEEAADRIAKLEAELAKNVSLNLAEERQRIAKLEAALAAIAALDEVSVTDFDQGTHQWRHQKIAREALS